MKAWRRSLRYSSRHGANVQEALRHYEGFTPHTFPLADPPTALRYARDRVEDATKVVVPPEATFARPSAAGWKASAFRGQACLSNDYFNTFGFWTCTEATKDAPSSPDKEPLSWEQPM